MEEGDKDKHGRKIERVLKEDGTSSKLLKKKTVIRKGKVPYLRGEAANTTTMAEGVGVAVVLVVVVVVGIQLRRHARPSHRV